MQRRGLRAVGLGRLEAGGGGQLSGAVLASGDLFSREAKAGFLKLKRHKSKVKKGESRRAGRCFARLPPGWSGLGFGRPLPHCSGAAHRQSAASRNNS